MLIRARKPSPFSVVDGYNTSNVQTSFMVSPSVNFSLCPLRVQYSFTVVKGNLLLWPTLCLHLTRWQAAHPGKRPKLALSDSESLSYKSLQIDVQFSQLLSSCPFHAIVSTASTFYRNFLLTGDLDLSRCRDRHRSKQRSHPQEAF